jgi:hypothetical protein
VALARCQAGDTLAVDSVITHRSHTVQDRPQSMGSGESEYGRTKVIKIDGNHIYNCILLFDNKLYTFEIACQFCVLQAFHVGVCKPCFARERNAASNFWAWSIKLAAIFFYYQCGMECLLVGTCCLTGSSSTPSGWLLAPATIVSRAACASITALYPKQANQLSAQPQVSLYDPGLDHKAWISLFFKNYYIIINGVI